MHLSKITVLVVFLLVSFFIIYQSSSAQACTRILWKTASATVSARTMDLYISDEPSMTVYPRGIKRDGNAGNNSMQWKSKYGSTVITGFNHSGTSDGINEKGFAAHLLYLHVTEYEKRDNRPGLANSMWAQYFLDNFSTVDEAVKSLDKFQLVSIKLREREWPLHLAIEDVTGDSAIIEYIKGKMVVHHNPEYKVMTNEPAYELQLENLKKYKLFGGNLVMPGDIDPMSRFVRASSYLKTLPEPKNEIDAIAYILGVIRNTAATFGAKDTSGSEAEDAWPTRWITVMDLTHRVYYFSATTSPNIFWVELKKLDFSEGAPVMTLDPHNLTLSGEVSKEFYPFSN